MVRHVLVLMVFAGCSFATEIPQPSPGIDSQQLTIDAAPDAPIAQLCMQRFGTADSYELCLTTPTSCKFYVHTNDGSCGDLCASLGGTCIESYDGDCSAISSTIRDCTFTLGDQVCNCRP